MILCFLLRVTAPKSRWAASTSELVGYCLTKSDTSQDSIRTEEYTEFNELTAQLNVANGKGEKLKAAEARTKALALIAEYPDLVRDYDKFTTAARTMAAAVWSKVPKDKQK